MNIYDTEQMAAGLSGIGYVQTFSPETADLVMVNTCSVRAKAEQKAFSFLGRMAKLKRKNPRLIVGVAGCVAQQEGERILKRMPHVDLVLGTGAIGRLPRLVHQIETRRRRIVDVREAEPIADTDVESIDQAESPASRFVTVMRGCDNYCAYCVVPYVRGPEWSRHPQHIVAEIRSLVAAGAREVTLLGQNVNSYGKKEGVGSFVELLNSVSRIEGLARIRFTTSHPKDLGRELIEAFSAVSKLCPHIHLPVQSGSDTVLRRMRRRYTREDYLDKVHQLRDTCPGIAITSDMIVGFPGETDADFEQTLDLVETVGFDGLFAFIYSDRPHAPARRYGGKIPETVKSGRLQALLELQGKFTLMKNAALVGSCQEVLVEGASRKQPGDPTHDTAGGVQWTGRTRTNKIVNFRQHHDAGKAAIAAGQLVAVDIERALAHSLWGVPAGSRTNRGE
jgi:tRNA-2-methylthio-N6-dimethylallyladenosine synthase